MRQSNLSGKNSKSCENGFGLTLILDKNDHDNNNYYLNDYDDYYNNHNFNHDYYDNDNNEWSGEF